MHTIESILKQSTYQGRGIIIGINEDYTEAFIAYFIMGRSENSRNRIFKINEKQELETIPFKNIEIKNKDLVIYTAISKFKEKIIVTNGTQTETISKGLENNKTFEESLKETKFEEDPPILTPRISAILNLENENITYKFSIIKSNNKNINSVSRFFFQYQNPLKGLGHFIHTYKETEKDPTNSFFGEPIELIIPKKLNQFTEKIWDSLNKENRISLFTKSINLKTKEEKNLIINKNK